MHSRLFPARSTRATGRAVGRTIGRAHGDTGAAKPLGAWRAALALSGLLFTGLLSACDTATGSILGGSEPATQMPGLKIELPPPPSFAEPNIPLQYDDGSVSIYGLRKHMKKYLGQAVKVKAYLLELYLCPVCPKKQTCKPCDQPNFFVTDEPNGKKEKALMVTDYRGQKAKDPKMTAGKQYVFEGTFNVNSPGGFAASDGLLVFTKMVDDSGKDYLSPAEDLQQKALAGQAKEKAAYDKAMKAKAGQK